MSKVPDIQEAIRRASNPEVDEPERKGQFRRNMRLEALLRELNSLLVAAEDEALGNYTHPKYPIVFIVGNPRAGTTLIYQLLAEAGPFCYPSNLLSRFYAAPYIGAKIQQLLTDGRYAHSDQFEDFKFYASFESDLGKTSGILAPNEFWYFWRYHFPYSTETYFLDAATQEGVDTERFLAELAAFEAAFNKPLVMKAMIANLDIPFLADVVRNALFLHVKRHPLFNVQSLLEGRVKQFGDRNVWFSFKPREYPQLVNLDPIGQVAGQVYFLSRDVEKGLGQLDPSRVIEITYEELCASPGLVFSQVKAWLRAHDYEISHQYSGPDEFKLANRIRLPMEEMNEIVDAYYQFSGERLSL